MIGIIWAQSTNGVIGSGGTLPWHVPEDLGYFREVTMGSTVVMGRKTWESLNPKYRPLPGRKNVVLTRDASWRSEGVQSICALRDVLSLPGPIWIIGGGELYRSAMDLADTLDVTEIDVTVRGDTYAPQIGDAWRLDNETHWQASTSGVWFRHRTFNRVRDDRRPVRVALCLAGA